MEIREVNLDEIQENSWNPNVMEEKDFDALVLQIKEKGCRQTLLIRPIKSDNPYINFEIVDGCWRRRACLKAGLEKAFCVIQELSDWEAKTATIAMNKLRGEMGEFDLAKLLGELKTTKEITEITKYTGIEEKEIKILLNLLEMPSDLSKLTETQEEKTITLTFLIPENKIKEIENVLDYFDNNRSKALIALCQRFSSHLTAEKT